MALQKFLFEYDFGTPEKQQPQESYDSYGEPMPVVEEEVPPPPPPPPTFSEEELQQARDQAFTEGREAGVAEAQGATEQQLVIALTLVGEQLSNLQAEMSRSHEEASRQAVRVAMATVAKLLPETARLNRLDEMAAMVEQCLSRVLDEPRLLVRCHAEMTDELRPRLEGLAANLGYEGRLVVSPDARLKPGDLRVEWTDGGAERDEQRLWREINAVLERAVGPALVEPEPPPAGAAEAVDDEPVAEAAP